MNIHWLQHVAFEGLGSIKKWALSHGHALSCTQLFAGDILPPLNAFDLLIVMGGPMGVHEVGKYQWLREEKDFLQQVIAAGNPILGICLGAQLLADVLGAPVTANKEKEIGWFPVTRTCASPSKAGVPEHLRTILPDSQTVFHWHGDTFALPNKAVPLYSSSACINQAFVYNERVIGLQFHLETTPESICALIENCREELIPAPWIQQEAEILAKKDIFPEINSWMEALLDYLVRQV